MAPDKLVRDKIPEIISLSGREPVTHVADDAEYWSRLKDKLLEEVKEFIEDGDEKEELADVFEVLNAIMDFRKLDKSEVEEIRLKKAEKKGGFKEKIVLDKIISQD